MRRPTEAILGDGYADLVKAGEEGYRSILLEPAGGYENLADRLADWLLRPVEYPPSDKWWFETRTVFDLARELDAWVSFQADNPDA